MQNQAIHSQTKSNSNGLLVTILFYFSSTLSDDIYNSALEIL